MINLQNLIDDAKCYETVRDLRWPEGVRCPHCESGQVTKQGRDTTQAHWQKYYCKGCHRHFDDLMGMIFAGHHQPLRVWIVCLYLMGLNVSNRQIAQELGLNKDDVQSMTGQLREGVVARRRRSWSSFWRSSLESILSLRLNRYPSHRVAIA
jgi:transposase-like protein